MHIIPVIFLQATFLDFFKLPILTYTERKAEVLNDLLEIRSQVTRENKVVESASMQPDQKQQTLKSKYFQLILALVSNIFLLEFDVDQNRDDAKDI